MKIMSIVRWVCLFPFIVLFGVWYIIKFMLGLIVLALVAWLVHALFGNAGDVVLALPVIYFLSYLLPNPQLGDIANTFMFKLKFRENGKSRNLPKAQVVDFKAYRRGAKP